MKIDSNHCSVLKECQALVKSKTVSVRASKKHQQIRFTAFNDTTNVLLYHQIPAKVDEDATFAVATERLIALLCRKDVKIGLKFNGNTLAYNYRSSKGVVETFSFESHEHPKIEKDRVLTKTLKQNASYLSLKTVIENMGNFIFIEEGSDTYLAAADAGAYHAVLVKKKGADGEASSLTLPQEHVQNALRALKSDDIQICTVGENLFCYTKDDNLGTTIIRFRNVAETNIKIDIIKRAVESKNLFEFSIKSDVFNDILADYKVIDDKERGGIIKINLDPKSISMTSETRHGKSDLEIPVKTNTNFSFSISTRLLIDILRFKDQDIKLAVKKEMNVMTLTQQVKDTEVTFMCSIEKHDRS